MVLSSRPAVSSAMLLFFHGKLFCLSRSTSWHPTRALIMEWDPVVIHTYYNFVETWIMGLNIKIIIVIQISVTGWIQAYLFYKYRLNRKLLLLFRFPGGVLLSNNRVDRQLQLHINIYSLWGSLIRICIINLSEQNNCSRSYVIAFVIVSNSVNCIVILTRQVH